MGEEAFIKVLGGDSEIMALRNSPYLPLYVQDFITDERLAECSASATGVYIRLMCLLHKSEQYGVILLKQKYKQTNDQIYNFALNLSRHFPYTVDEISEGLTELEENGVICICNDTISQKRMVKDGRLSEIRSESGRKGGNISSGKEEVCLTKIESKIEANIQANTDNDNEYDIDNVNDNKVYKEVVDYIYSLYPTFCPNRNKSTGKSKKDKEKIKSLLKSTSKEELEFTIKTYAKQCSETNAYLKNFSAFLNQMPDVGYGDSKSVNNSFPDDTPNGFVNDKGETWSSQLNKWLK